MSLYIRLMIVSILSVGDIISGIGALAQGVSVTSTFISAGPATDCDDSISGNQVHLPGTGCFFVMGGVSLSWYFTENRCEGYVELVNKGYRMPTLEEFHALYNVYPNGGLSNVFGWSTYSPYWTGTKDGDLRAYSINIVNGVEAVENTGSALAPACMRPE